MSETHWATSLEIDKPLNVTADLLAFVYEAVSSMSPARIEVSISLPNGERRTVTHKADLEKLSEGLFAQIQRIGFTAESDSLNVRIALTRDSHWGATLEISSKSQGDLLVVQGLAREMESRFLARDASGAFISGQLSRIPPAAAIAISATGADQGAAPVSDPHRIEAIREVPRKLPHAKIYLNDLQEIANILVEACRSPRSPNPAVQLSSDTETYASFAAMAKQGGTTHNFTLTVGNWSPSLRFYSLLPPELSLAGLDKEKQWSAYAKIRGIFDTRSYKLKNSFGELPTWTKWLLYCVWLLLPYAARFASDQRSGLIGASLWLVLSLLGLSEYFRRSAIVFQDSHAKRDGPSDRTITYAQNFLFALLGAALSVALQALYDHFKHRA